MNDQEKLYDVIKRAGGVANNRTTRLQLGWDYDKYFSARDGLIDGGLAPGQRGGPGGSTALLLSEDQIEFVEDNTQSVNAKNIGKMYGSESSLYQPVLTQLKTKWATFERYDNLLAYDTSTQGRRDTGGKWTRPDISVIATKRFKFLPLQHFEIVTFEVKPRNQIGVEGVFEALSHRHSVHRSYLLINCDSDEFESSREADRVTELLQRHEVGLYLAEDPSDFETWVEYVIAPRWEPDPFHVNAFIQNVVPSECHDEVLKMLK